MVAYLLEANFPTKWPWIQLRIKIAKLASTRNLNWVPAKVLGSESGQWVI